MRQNDHENQLVFDAADVGLILQSSLTTARRILKHLISPQIEKLIDHLREQGEGRTEQIVNRLAAAVGERVYRTCGESICAVRRPWLPSGSWTRGAA